MVQVRLSDVCEISHGYAFQGQYFSDDLSWPTLLTPGNFRVGGGFQSTKPKTFRGEIPAAYVLEPGTLVVTMTDLSRDGDTLGYSALVPEGRTYLHNQRVGRVSVTNPEVLDERYLHWLMRTKSYRNHVLASATGSTVRHTSPSRVLSFVADLPAIHEQRQIAKVLESLDHLIECDLLLASDCDQLARNLWLEATDSLEPTVCVSDFAEVVLGGTPARNKPELWGGEVAWLNSGKANDFRVIKPSETITKLGLEKSSAKLMPSGTTIIAITGATLGQISRTEIEACGNQSVVGVFSSNKAINDFLYFGIQDQVDVLLQSATGGAQQHVNKANVEKLKLKWLDEVKLAEWHSDVEPLMRATRELLFEADELAKVRDELLPMLTSGLFEVGQVAA